MDSNRGGGGDRRVRIPDFPLNWFENPPRRGGVQWKRAVLGRGGGDPTSQYCTQFKNNKKTVTNLIFVNFLVLWS